MDGMDMNLWYNMDESMNGYNVTYNADESMIWHITMVAMY
jgi:hypothetical protein